MQRKRKNNRKMSERKTSGIARARRKRKIIIFSVLTLVSLLIVWTIIYFCLRHAVNKVAEDAAYEGVYLEELDVSGMNRNEIEELLREHVEEFSGKTIEVQAEESETDMTLGELGFGIKSIEDTAESAVSYAKKGSVWNRFRKMRKAGKEHKVLDIPYILERDTAKTAFEEKRAELEAAAKDAAISHLGEELVVAEEKDGWTLRIEESVIAIEAYLNKEWDKKSAAAEAVVNIEKPEITKEQLSVVQNLLGTYQTYCGSSGGRVQNIETGSALINGTIIMPGEEFSADAAMRPYTEEKGYTEAGSYESGKVVQTLGGGICQISSTLYNAVLLSELEVTQRQAHSMLVDYVKPSMDAAIAGDVKDLKFKNNTESPIYIECYVANEHLTVNIYGKETRPENRTIEFVSEVTATEEPVDKYEEASDKWIATIKKVDGGHVGKTAKLWKVVYEDGKEVSREEVNSSQYRMSNAIIIVGTDSTSERASATVRNSIASQNMETIQAAINSAREIEQNEKQQDNTQE